MKVTCKKCGHEWLTRGAYWRYLSRMKCKKCGQSHPEPDESGRREIRSRVRESLR